MPATEEASGGGERRRVRCGEHVMLAGVDEPLLLDGVVAPKQEDEPLTLHRQPLDGAVSEGLPAVPLVRARLMRPHRERRVEQQHPLVGPRLQIPASRRHKSHIRDQLLEDVLQRLRNRHPVLHRETQAVRLPFPMVRVLPDDHHLHLVERRRVERVENLRSRREHHIMLLFFYQKGFQFREIRRLELVPEDLLPGWFYLRVDGFVHDGM